jgi:eukaryotic-like serine/threonine-protein kinase
MATPTPTNVPSQLGKYAISEILGKGAMGVVYKGFDPHIKRTVALKTIRKDMVDDDQAAMLLARFKNEAEAAGRLTHPGIVAVYDADTLGDIVYIAMEYVKGNSLREYFNRGTPFEGRDAISVMTQLLDALHYAHEQGVYHRDIKPANIIVMDNGKLKIADFGIARVDSSQLTQTGAVMGTPGYMAPEQYSGESVDWRVDIFSAGVIMYQLLTGRRPFVGNPDAIAYKICHEQPTPPSEVNPGGCPTEFDAVTLKALSKNPEDRYQDALAFRDAVLEAHAGPVSPTVSEQTLIIAKSRPVGQGERSRPLGQEPSQPSHPSGVSPPSHPSQPSVPPTGWDAGLLKQVEQQLRRILGPVAKVLVRRAATNTTDVETLYAFLAENLSSPEERSAFLAGRRELKGVPPRPLGATTMTILATQMGTRQTQPLTPEVIEKATRRLIVYLGPIAKVLAKRAAEQASTRHHFHLLLAERIVDPVERDQFLRDVGAG